MNEKSIQYHILKDIIITKKKVILYSGIILLLISLLFAFLLPKKYTSTVLLQVKPQGSVALEGATGSMLALTGLSSGDSALEYMGILKSDRVINPVINKLDNKDGEDELFTSEDFLKKYMKVDSTRGTSLLSIEITAESPEEAQTIASNVTTSFQKALIDISDTQDSGLVKILDGKIDAAKKELDANRQALASYSQESGIYAPKEQEKILLDQFAGYEKAKSEAMVQASTNEAILSNIEGQINDQNLKAMESKMADNPEVQEIRSKLLNANETLAMLKFKFTDAQPDVLKAQEKVNYLNGELSRAISGVIKSESTTLNSAQGELLKKRIFSKVNLEAANASIATLDKLSEEGKKVTNALSSKSIKYAELAQKLKISEDTYKLLVKSAEELKVKENLNSFDVRIIDPATLPVKHSWPRKIYVVLAGFVLYMAGIGGYLYIQYRRKIG